MRMRSIARHPPGIRPTKAFRGPSCFCLLAAPVLHHSTPVSPLGTPFLFAAQPEPVERRRADGYALSYRGEELLIKPTSSNGGRGETTSSTRHHLQDPRIQYISDPVSLARVASSSKLWRSIIKESAFLEGLMTRYLDHGFTSSLLLGFFYQDNAEAPDHLWQHHRDQSHCLAPSFMPTSELLPFTGCKEGYNPTSPLSLGNFIQGINSSLNFYEPVASQDSFLVLCHHSKDDKGDPKPDVVCICNPLSGEVFHLPTLQYKPPHHYTLLVSDDINPGLCMTQSFRLVAIWNIGKKFIYVYYCSKSRAWWRPAGFPELMAGLFLLSSSPAAATHGVIHWICGCWKSLAPSHVVTLHVDGEELLYLELPSEAKRNKTPLLANSADRGLLLLLMKGLHMSLWKHKGTGTGTGNWVHSATIDMTSSLPMRLLKMHTSAKIRLEIFQGKSGVVVLWIEGEGLFTFSLGDRSMRKIDNEHVTKKYRFCPYEIDWLSCLAVTNLVSDGLLSLDTERKKAQCRWRSLVANNIPKSR